jgi:nucleotide-binding universal stress UspA family protein
MKTVLVALDFSDLSHKVLQVAGELAGATKAKVVLLHVVEPLASYVPVGASMDVIATPPPPIEPEDTKGPEERLGQEAEKLRAAGLEVETSVIVGLAVDDILSKADALAADYLVVGSHGHGALYHLFSGSVVTGILKRAKSTVVVVPAVKHK